ncbi:hypothetical protein Sjap_002793 [Stephania japonica]|uniref:Uncharacterized protein n=1 Tax=Stephania japonica TaxID=461633 RepID=A0AAP0KP25_9MAGN
MGDLLGSPPSSVVQGSRNLGTYPCVSVRTSGAKDHKQGPGLWMVCGLRLWAGTLPVRSSGLCQQAGRAGPLQLVSHLVKFSGL